MTSIICLCAGPRRAHRSSGAQIVLHAEPCENDAGLYFEPAGQSSKMPSRRGISPTKMFSATVKSGTMSGS